MPTSSNPFYADLSGAFGAPAAELQNYERNALEMSQLAAEGPQRVRGMQLQNAKLERDAAASAELKALFSGGMQDDGTPKSEQIMRLGKKVGAVDTNLASRLFALSSDMLLEEARAGKANADAALAKAKALQRNTDWLYSVIGEVGSEAEYESRRMRMLSTPGFVTTPENRVILENTPFEAYRVLPQLAEAERKRVAQEIAEDRARTYAGFARVADERTQVQRTAAEQREARLGAAVKPEKPTPVPGPRRVQQAAVYLKNTEEGRELSGTLLRNAAADIEARVDQIRQRNPAVPVDAARVMALDELKKVGALRQEETAWGGKRWTYNSVSAHTPRAAGPSGAPRRVKIQAGEVSRKDKQGNTWVVRNGAWVQGE